MKKTVSMTIVVLLIFSLFNPSYGEESKSYILTDKQINELTEKVKNEKIMYLNEGSEVIGVIEFKLYDGDTDIEYVTRPFFYTDNSHDEELIEGMVKSFYEDQKAVTEILTLNGVPLKDTKWSQYAGKITMDKKANSADGESGNIFADSVNDIKEVITDANDEFSDMKGHWANKYVKELVDMGVIYGYEDNTFRPNEYISKGEFIKLLVLAIDKEPLLKDENEDEKYNIYIEKAKELDILRENEILDLRNLNGRIKRREVSLLVARALGFTSRHEIMNRNIEGIDTGKIYWKSDQLLNKYSQVFMDSRGAAISDYSCYALEKGVMTGYKEDGTFRSQQWVTRAEACEMVIRLIDENKRVIFNPEDYKMLKPTEIDKDDFMIPQFYVFQEGNGGSDQVQWFEFRILNYKDYENSTDRYKVKTECTNYPELNTVDIPNGYEDSGWSRYHQDKWKYFHNDEEAKRASNRLYCGKIWRLNSWYYTTQPENNDYLVYPNQLLKFKITIVNETKNITKTYNRDIITRDVNFWDNHKKKYKEKLERLKSQN